MRFTFRRRAECCAALLVWITAVACTGDEPPDGCATDNDCRGDRLCIDRVCRDPDWASTEGTESGSRGVSRDGGGGNAGKESPCGQCPAERAVCNPDNRQCVGCLSDADCSHDTPVCEAERCRFSIAGTWSGMLSTGAPVQVTATETEVTSFSTKVTVDYVNARCTSDVNLGTAKSTAIHDLKASVRVAAPNASLGWDVQLEFAAAASASASWDEVENGGLFCMSPAQVVLGTESTVLDSQTIALKRTSTMGGAGTTGTGGAAGVGGIGGAPNAPGAGSGGRMPSAGSGGASGIGGGPPTSPPAGTGGSANPIDSGVPNPSNACTGTAVEPVADYSTPGPFPTMMVTATGPNGQYTIFRPTVLGEGGFKHPPVSWANGVGASPPIYSQLLSKIASHGFVVIATNSTSPTQAQVTAGHEWLLAQDGTAGEYQGELATSCAVMIGHSFGAQAAIQAAVHPSVRAVVSLHGVPTALQNGNAPLLGLSSDNDSIVTPAMLLDTYSMSMLAPTLVALLQKGGTAGLDGHLLPSNSGGGQEHAPVVAWLRYWIYDDQSARQWFFGADCVLCGPPWTGIQRSNHAWQ